MNRLLIKLPVQQRDGVSLFADLLLQLAYALILLGQRLLSCRQRPAQSTDNTHLVRLGRRSIWRMLSVLVDRGDDVLVFVDGLAGDSGACSDGRDGDRCVGLAQFTECFVDVSAFGGGYGP